MKAGRLLLVCALIGALSGSSLAVETLVPGYAVESYVTYACPGTILAPREIAFDGSTRMYLSHWGHHGSIYRVNADKTVEQWATGLGTPRRIAWGGGTAYGDYLYVADADSLGILQIASDGADVPFVWPIFEAPTALAIDRTGTYGGQMFMATRVMDNVQVVTPTGSLAPFSDFPGSIDGGPLDLSFDPGVGYGGKLYITTSSPEPTVSGLFGLDTAGNAARFAPLIVDAFTVEVDSLGLMGGQMFVSGKSSFADPAYTIWQVDSSGAATPFARSTIGEGDLPTFTFGPDGALYVPEYCPDTQQVVISRITMLPVPIPAPGAGLLVCIGAACYARLRRRIAV